MTPSNVKSYLPWVVASAPFVVFLLGIGLLAAYGLHARQTTFPLLRLALFRIRTFRVSVVGGFITRMGGRRNAVRADRASGTGAGSSTRCTFPA